MITTAPLPTWRALLALAGRTVPDDRDLGAPWGGSLWFSRSAWSLHVVGRWLTEARGRPARIWLPGYFCNQSLEPLRRAGAELAFYPVGDTLAPDWTACESMAEERAPDAFVLAHYFGAPNDLAAAADFRDRWGPVLIEDAAHVLRPAAGIGSVGDIVLYSPHKVVGIPDGAVVAARDGVAAELAAVAAGLPDAAPPWRGWAARRLAQMTVPEAVARRLRPPAPCAFDDDPPPSTPPATPRMSQAARRMLAALVPNLEPMAHRRRDAHAAVCAAVADLDGWQPLVGEWAKAAPYRAVMRCETGALAAERFAALRRRGILAESWPDLPPEVLAESQAHRVAITLRRTLILLPLDTTVSATAAAAPYRKCRDALPGNSR